MENTSEQKREEKKTFLKPQDEISRIELLQDNQGLARLLQRTRKANGDYLENLKLQSELLDKIQIMSGNDFSNDQFLKQNSKDIRVKNLRQIFYNFIKDIQQTNQLVHDSSPGLDNETLKFIAKLIRKNLDLRKISLYGDGLTYEDIQILSEGLKETISLKEIRFGKNPLGLKGLTLLCSSLSLNCSLRVLILNDIRITSEDTELEGFSSLLSKNKSIEKLYIGYNEFGGRGFELICSGLKNNTTLKKLDCRNCRLTKEDCVYLSDMLVSNESLENLNLSDNNIKKKGLRNLSRGIRATKSLKKLKLKSNEIHCNKRTKSLGIFSESLQANKSIEKLDISSNFLARSGMKTFVEFLCGNDTLKKLTIGHYLEDEEIQALSMNLRQNSNLEELNLIGYMQLTCRGLRSISNILKNSKSLKVLSFSDCRLSDFGMRFICEGLEHNEVLEELKVEHLDISDHGMKYLNSALKINGSLKKINLCSNNITSEGVKCLIEALKSNENVQEIDLSENNIDDDGVIMWANFLKDNNTIQKFRISENKFTEETELKVCDILGLQNKDLLCGEINIMKIKELNKIPENNLLSDNKKLSKYVKMMIMKGKQLKRQIELKSEEVEMSRRKRILEIKKEMRKKKIQEFTMKDKKNIVTRFVKKESDGIILDLSPIKTKKTIHRRISNTESRPRSPLSPISMNKLNKKKYGKHLLSQKQVVVKNGFLTAVQKKNSRGRSHSFSKKDMNDFTLKPLTIY